MTLKFTARITRKKSLEYVILTGHNEDKSDRGTWYIINLTSLCKCLSEQRLRVTAKSESLLRFTKDGKIAESYEHPPTGETRHIEEL